MKFYKFESSDIKMFDVIYWDIQFILDFSNQTQHREKISFYMRNVCKEEFVHIKCIQ